MPNHFDLSSDAAQELFRAHNNSYWEFHIPDPRLDADRSGYFYGVTPQPLQSSANPFMARLPSGIEVPLPDAWNISDGRQWTDINVAATLSDFEEWASSEMLWQASWRFLKKWVNEDLIKLCARIACSAELNYSNIEFWQTTAREMYLPEEMALRPKLIARLKDDSPPFNHHCVRTTMQLLAMLHYVGEDHTETESTSYQSEFDAIDGISALFFPELEEVDMLTVTSQILTALWLLHDKYYEAKAFTSSRTTETALEALYEERYVIKSPVHWLERLRTYWGMWSIPDDHPSVYGNVVPSQMRQEFHETIGEYPENLIQALCSQLANMLVPSEDEWDVDDDMLHVIYDHTNQNIEQFARESHESDATGDRYLTCIKYPFLVFADEIPILHSTEFLVSQTCDLYWSRVANFDNDKLGPLFEAHVCNALHDLLGDNDRYHIVYSKTLEEVASLIRSRRQGSNKSCDVLIYDKNQKTYLFIEIGIQRISRRALSGQVGEAASRVTSLEKKLIQILDFRDELSSPNTFNSIRDHIPGEGPTEGNSGCLVVVMEHMHSPIFTQQRTDQCSRGPKRAFSSLYDFRYLLHDGADLGIGVPGVVRSWQNLGTDRSLGRFIADYGSGPIQ